MREKFGLDDPRIVLAPDSDPELEPRMMLAAHNIREAGTCTHQKGDCEGYHWYVRLEKARQLSQQYLHRWVDPIEQGADAPGVRSSYALVQTQNMLDRGNRRFNGRAPRVD